MFYIRAHVCILCREGGAWDVCMNLILYMCVYVCLSHANLNPKPCKPWPQPRVYTQTSAPSNRSGLIPEHWQSKGVLRALGQQPAAKTTGYRYNHHHAASIIDIVVIDHIVVHHRHRRHLSYDPGSWPQLREACERLQFNSDVPRRSMNRASHQRCGIRRRSTWHDSFRVPFMRR